MHCLTTFLIYNFFPYVIAKVWKRDAILYRLWLAVRFVLFQARDNSDSIGLGHRSSVGEWKRRRYCSRLRGWVGKGGEEREEEGCVGYAWNMRLQCNFMNRMAISMGSIFVDLFLRRTVGYETPDTSGRYRIYREYMFPI